MKVQFKCFALFVAGLAFVSQTPRPTTPIYRGGRIGIRWANRGFEVVLNEVSLPTAPLDLLDDMVGFSSYSFSHGNPISRVDIDGRKDVLFELCNSSSKLKKMKKPLIISCSILIASFLPSLNQLIVDQELTPEHHVDRTKQSLTIEPLARLSPRELEGMDTALLNLVCASGLPGSEQVNIPEAVATLDKWAVHVREETERNWQLYRSRPAEFMNS